MRTRNRSATAIMALLAGGVATELTSGPASATVGIRNSTGGSIEHVYTTPAEEDQWGPDLLATPLLSGESRLFAQVDCGDLDVKLVDAAGRQCVFESMDLCLNNPCDLPAGQTMEGAYGTWEVTTSQLAGCPGFGQ